MIRNVFLLWCALYTLASAQPPSAADLQNAELHVLPVQGNTYMMVGPGGNITIQTGKDGVLLVDTMFAPLAQRIAAEIKKLSNQPIRYIIDTHVHGDHVGGNEPLQKMGAAGASQVMGGGATVIAHNNVLNRMTTPVTGSQAPPPQTGLPNDEYDTPTKDFFFNGEAVVIFHEPAAHTDGDSIVFFRRSDVISAGDVFVTTSFPFIDTASGGSYQGYVAALEKLVDIIIPVYGQDGGTLVIPGHGRISNLGDVLNYREMVIVVGDRIKHMIEAGMTLEQVKAAKPTFDYDPVYGARAGAADRFIEETFETLRSPPGEAQ